MAIFSQFKLSIFPITQNPFLFLSDII